MAGKVITSVLRMASRAPHSRKGKGGPREHCVIVENVIGFEESVLESLVGPVFKMYTYQMTPTQTGVPVERKRKYMILLHTQLRWNTELLGEDHQLQYEQLFACPVRIRGDDLARVMASVLWGWVWRK